MDFNDHPAEITQDGEERQQAKRTDDNEEKDLGPSGKLGYAKEGGNLGPLGVKCGDEEEFVFGHQDEDRLVIEEKFLDGWVLFLGPDEVDVMGWVSKNSGRHAV